MSTFPAVTELLPHRPPFLFIDEVVELEARRVVAVRTFRADEDFFRGHFPEKPIVPGVLLLEGLAQSMAYLASSQGSSRDSLLVGIDRVRFKGVVGPASLVRFEVDVEEERMGLVKGRGRVFCDGKLVADAELLTGYHPAPSAR